MVTTQIGAKVFRAFNSNQLRSLCIEFTESLGEFKALPATRGSIFLGDLGAFIALDVFDKAGKLGEECVAARAVDILFLSVVLEVSVNLVVPEVARNCATVAQTDLNPVLPSWARRHKVLVADMAVNML